MARKGKNSRKRRPSVRALMSRNAKKERNIPYLEELQLASNHQAAGRLGQAEEILQRVLADKSNHPMALNLLGRLYCGSGRVEIFLCKSIVVATPSITNSFKDLWSLCIASSLSLPWHISLQIRLS